MMVITTYLTSQNITYHLSKLGHTSTVFESELNYAVMN